MKGKSAVSACQTKCVYRLTAFHVSGICFTGLTAKTTLQRQKVYLNQLPRLVHFAIVKIYLVHWNEYQLLTVFSYQMYVMFTQVVKRQAQM